MYLPYRLHQLPDRLPMKASGYQPFRKAYKKVFRSILVQKAVLKIFFGFPFELPSHLH